MCKNDNNLLSYKWIVLYLAIISALGYVFSYSYEVGYLKYFGLGWSFAELPLSRTISNSIQFLLFFSIIIIIVLLLHFIIKKRQRKTKRFIHISLIVVVLTLAVFIFLSFFNIFCGSLFAVFSIVEILLITFLWDIKLFQQSNGDDSKYRMFDIFIAVLTVVSIYCFGMSMGGLLGKTNSFYYVIKDKPGHVVISKCENYVIAVPVNMENKTFTKEYIFKLYGEDITLENKVIGPFSPEE